MKKKIGAAPGDLSPLRSREDVIKYINLKLAMLGQTGFGVDDETKKDDSYFIDLFSGIIEDYKEKSRLLKLLSENTEKESIAVNDKGEV